MQVQAGKLASPEDRATVGIFRDRTGLAVLLVLSAGLHAWVVANTVVTARDSLGFIRYALILEDQPWPAALRSLEQHPLYPLAILGMSWILRPWLGYSPETMVLSCQVASALGGVLLVVPMYLLGRELFDRRSAFWATAMFQCLPIGLKATSDGISEGVYLPLVATALLFAVKAFHRQCPWKMLGCGVFAGLAYLARPEGLLLTGVASLVLLANQTQRTFRWPGKQAGAGLAALVVGAALPAGPYMAAIGGLTVKPGPTKILFNIESTDTLGQTPEISFRDQSITTTGPLFAAWWMDENQPGAPPLWWGIKSVGREVLHGFHYVSAVLAGVGLWVFRRRLSDPGPWVILLFCALLAGLLIRVCLSVHYLSERHTLGVVMAGCLWGGAALIWLTDRCPAALKQGILTLKPGQQLGLSLAILLAGTSWCLPASLKPLHANRLGHRCAGEWLASNGEPALPVVDPFGWARFYAGQGLREGDVSDQPGSPRYVVLTRSKNAHARLTGLPDAQQAAKHGTMVYHWVPTEKQRRRWRAEEVVVYLVPGNGELSSPQAEWRP